MTHTIIIKPSEHVLKTVEGETLLQAALREGISLPYGCRNGSCGICKGKILEGDVDYGCYNEETLTEEDKQNGMALFCCAEPKSDLVVECHEISAIKDIEIKTLPARVEKLERIASDVMIVSLKLPANQRLQFLAGQYIDILLKEGKRRSFSLANAPHDDEVLQLHVRNYPGGLFTEYVFTQMKIKEIIRLEGPLGSFFLRDTSPDMPIIFLASGTGFAPIKSILEHVFHMESSGDNTNNLPPMTLYWGVRTRVDLYLLDLIDQWQQQHKNFSFVPVLSDALPEDNWKGRKGLIHEVVLEDYATLENHQVYACGSPVMVKAAYQDFTTLRNLPKDGFFSDVFTPSVNNTP